MKHFNWIYAITEQVKLIVKQIRPTEIILWPVNKHTQLTTEQRPETNERGRGEQGVATGLEKLQQRDIVKQWVGLCGDKFRIQKCVGHFL